MYVELHARSAFSFLEGASSPEELVEACARLEMPAMALVDRDGVYGAPRFYQAAKKAGIRAHVGAEVTSTEGFRYTLLAETRTGYQNLCRLITRMKLRAPKGEGAASEDDLAEFAEGLICLTGGDEGPLTGIRGSGLEARKIRGSGFGIRDSGRKISLPAPNPEFEEFFLPKPQVPIPESRTPNPESRIFRLCDIFGRHNVYVELQRHLHRDEEARNQAAVELARALRLPVVATNGVCYAGPARREVLDVFTCIRNHRTLETAGRLLARNSERYLKPPEEMACLFADLPEAIAQTKELSSRLQFALSDLGYQFPRYPVPEGETMASFLRKRTEEGAIARYGRDYLDPRSRARQQIERELALIEKLDLAGYFLIVWDIVRFCRERAILVQGRGSAANSAVCYALGITAVDPVRMELLFERFLSEERGEWPDIDLDLPSGDQRERAIQYIYERYGRLGAAMTANVITYRGRSAAREVGKVLGFDAEALDRLSGLVSAWEYTDEKDTMERHFRDAGFDLAQPRIRKFLELCLRLQDLPRHLGQHSGGMVICQGQLDSVVPLEPATMPGRVVVEWDKEDCADMGIVKVDLLGLGMMAVLEDTLELIRRHYGEEVDLAHLPQDDPEVYAALQQADTVGMFQVESRAQMSCLPRLRPRCFYDIVVEVAIIRPGPIVGNMVHPYLKRRQGREPVTYPHPTLEPALKRTLGVPLFQEQLLRVAMIAAGFTGGEAEDLRRAMGFKRSEARMKEIEKKLRLGMERNGITGEAQEQIVKSITSFALYGFPESHAASFALLAYASAYLKCRYLPAFTAALLNNQPMGFYHPATIVKDAQRHGLKVRPIDVTRSDWRCTLEKGRDSGLGTRGSARKNSLDTEFETCKEFFLPESRTPNPNPRLSRVPNPEPRTPAFAVRLGMSSVKGLREEAARAIIRERERTPFASIDDLARRVPELRKTELVMLAEIGALNWIGGDSEARNSKLETGNSKFETRKSKIARISEGVLPRVRSSEFRFSNFEFRTQDRALPAAPSQSQTVSRPSPITRRDALWQVERAARPAGPLLESKSEKPGFGIRDSGFGKEESERPGLGTRGSRLGVEEFFASREFIEILPSRIPNPESRVPASPLKPMTPEERLVSDFHGTGLTVGPHPMTYRRVQMKGLGVRAACELRRLPHGKTVRIAGCVIARQRPGTAKGFLFLSLEDETGIANAIVMPDLFQKHRFVLVHEPYLLIEGMLQKQDNVISVKAQRIQPLTVTRAESRSHDFH